MDIEHWEVVVVVCWFVGLLVVGRWSLSWTVVVVVVMVVVVVLSPRRRLAVVFGACGCHLAVGGGGGWLVVVSWLVGERTVPCRGYQRCCVDIVGCHRVAVGRTDAQAYLILNLDGPRISVQFTFVGPSLCWRRPSQKSQLTAILAESNDFTKAPNKPRFVPAFLRAPHSCSTMATVQPRSPGGHRLAPEEIEHKKKAQALLEKTAQQAREMEILAHLSFQPRAQTWARDPPSVSAAERDQNDADPNLVSHVIILRRFEAWAESCRRQVIDLQKHLVKQFMTAGLFVCQLNAEKSSLDSYFGLYASPDALLEEKRNLMSENLLSWNGAGVADLPTAMFVSPAEKMLLTLRIINRCIDFIRIRYAPIVFSSDAAPCPIVSDGR